MNCHICDIECIDERDYTNHLDDHTGDIFSTSESCDQLQSSGKIGKKLYKCFSCNSLFDRASQLDYHVRSIHLGEKSHVCQICCKGFFRKTDLKTHLNTHLGTNQSECKICGKKFNNISNLIRHSRSHSGLKPYSCSTCGKKFTQISSLTRHKNIHLKHLNNPADFLQTKEKTKRKHYCKVCDESFQFIKLLREHEKVHKAEVDLTDFIMQPSDPTTSTAIADDRLFSDANDPKMGDSSLQSDVFTSLNLPFVENHLKSSDLDPRLSLIDDDVEENINICDILNFCSPDDLQTDLMQRESNDEVIKKLLNIDTFVNKELQNKYLQVEGSQMFIEICKSDCLKSLELHSLELDELENISLLPESINNFEHNSEIINNNLETISTEFQNETPSVRLVQNEEGEQFFELVRDTIDFSEPKFNEQNENTTSNNLENNLQVDQNVSEVKKKPPRKRSTPKKPRKTFECHVCHKKFVKAANLNQHKGIHFLDQQKFQCKFCDKYFAWKSTLNKHLTNSHKTSDFETFVCEICPKVYNTLSQVNEHVRRDHLKIRNHVCSHCGKCFFKKSDLKSHVRTHTNEKPYICGVCGKSFYHLSHIIRHERMHSGERPYSCTVCEKSFTQLKSLKIHKQKHQNIMKIDILDYKIDDTI